MNEPQSQFENSDGTLTRTAVLLRRLQSALKGRLGKSPTYTDMAEWTGVGDRTIMDWFNNSGRPTAHFLLELLDRTSAHDRSQIINEACREWPTMESARFKCDRTMISQLKTILAQREGLTLIQGGDSAEGRTFFLSALANLFLENTERPCGVVGVDVHKPDWFVPVPGVKYLDNPIQLSRMRQAVRQAWPALIKGRLNLIILNGILSSMPKLQLHVNALARRRHIIVADKMENLKSRPRALSGLLVTRIAISEEGRQIHV